MLRGSLFWLCLVSLAGCDSGGSPSTLGGPDLAVAMARQGLVRASTTSQSVGGLYFSQLYMSAAFFDLSDSTFGCQQRKEGACTAYHCRGGATALLPNAGILTIGSGPQAMTLTPRQDGGYDPQSRTDTALFTSGQALLVSGAGATVSVFKSQVTLPGDTFTLSTPQVSAMLTAVIDRKTDLQVSFSTPVPNVLLELSQGLTTDHGTYIECLFPGGTGKDAGKGTVPASLLMDLLAGQAEDQQGRLLIGPVAMSTAPAGPWQVEVAAIGGGDTARIFFQ